MYDLVNVSNPKVHDRSMEKGVLDVGIDKMSIFTLRTSSIRIDEFTKETNYLCRNKWCCSNRRDVKNPYFLYTIHNKLLTVS